ncbi:MAG: hypothetical protein M5R36_17080 [Deltaproteobacteria bacterium]|nr:hypothetical protein [Deltaproteobacteria bacterium]
MKAQDYDAWHEMWHQPGYGSTVEVRFTDAGRTTVQSYGGTGDACMWTGTYLASQALRYHVTGEAQAKANAIRAAEALDRHLHVTGKPGFIARYVGEQSDPAHAGEVARCVTEPDYVHCLDTGEFAGDFWKGNTSRDQYTGWFFGMSLAYDLVDDTDMRTMIRDDVEEVLDALIAQNWKIIDVDGQPTTAAPSVITSQQMNWALIGYHITGEERFFDIVKEWAHPEKRAVDASVEHRADEPLDAALRSEPRARELFNLLRLMRPYCDRSDWFQGCSASRSTSRRICSTTRFSRRSTWRRAASIRRRTIIGTTRWTR